MTMTEEMKAMVRVLKEKDSDFRNGSYKSYFSPDIPEKIVKKLIKYFDNHLAINSIIAFFDNTIYKEGEQV